MKNWVSTTGFDLLGFFNPHVGFFGAISGLVYLMPNVLN